MSNDALRSELATLLRDCATREMHTTICEQNALHFRDPCTCDRDARILVRQALVMVELIKRGMWCRYSHGHEFNWTAALQAHAGHAALDAPEETQ